MSPRFFSFGTLSDGTEVTAGRLENTAGASLTRIRLAGIDVTGKSDILVALRNMGVRGLDANGDAIAELCSKTDG